eukprot:gene10458-biopygen7442
MMTHIYPGSRAASISCSVLYTYLLPRVGVDNSDNSTGEPDEGGRDSPGTGHSCPVMRPAIAANRSTKPLLQQTKHRKFLFETAA